MQYERISKNTENFITEIVSSLVVLYAQKD